MKCWLDLRDTNKLPWRLKQDYIMLIVLYWHWDDWFILISFSPLFSFVFNVLQWGRLIYFDQFLFSFVLFMFSFCDCTVRQWQWQDFYNGRVANIAMILEKKITYFFDRMFWSTWSGHFKPMNSTSLKVGSTVRF